jgi:hypothetical protein
MEVILRGALGKGSMSWNKKLSRVLVLRDGTRLVTLSDVRAVFLDRFQNIIQSAPLAHAGTLLLEAASTGRRADIAAATEQIELALRHQRQM